MATSRVMEWNLSLILMTSTPLRKGIALKEKHGGEVTVVTFGEEEAEKELRTALAMGADKAVLIDSEEIEEGDQFYYRYDSSNLFKR